MRALLITSICSLLITGCGDRAAVNSSGGDESGAGQNSGEKTKLDLTDFEYEVQADLVIISKGKGAGQVIIPEEIEGAKVTEIANNAFFRNIQMTSVTIPGTVTAIGNDSFKGCIGLTAVTIPASVTSVGSSAFSGCVNLKEVKFLGDAPPETKYMFKDAPVTIYYDPSTSGWNKPFAGKVNKPIQ